MAAIALYRTYRASARSETIRIKGWVGISLPWWYNRSVHKATAAQIDYSSLTPFERKWISGGLFPFWAYLSRVSVWGSKAMLKDMTYFNTAIRAPMVLGGGRGNEYMPTRIEEKYGIPFNKTFMELFAPILNQDLEGSTYLADIDIPFVDSILMIDPAFVARHRTTGYRRHHRHSMSLMGHKPYADTC